jgi:pyrroline-5-carboxylate reductase
MSSQIDIALIGCGKMGGALLRGWLQAGIARRVSVLEPHAPADIHDPRVVFHKEAAALATRDIYVLAVKPQIMDDVCRSLKNIIPAGALVLSIAAGRTIASFENHFGAAQPVVRAMPNLPASIGEGATVAVANARVSTPQKQQADSILAAAGLVEWVDDEALMNAVTAVSGSGPAYVFLLIETLGKAGEKAGLPAALARKLARQTVIGSAALAAREADTPAETLRKNVTSPGGTTEAALKILMDDGALQTLFDTAIAAAAARGLQLNS